MLLETLLHNNHPPHEITHLFKRKNVTFFKIHGESFCTAAGKVVHSSSPVYDSGFIHELANQAHDVKHHEEHVKMVNDLTHQDELYNKHRLEVLKMIFTQAVNTLVDRGEDAFLKFIDHHIEIYPERGARTIVSRLEKE